MNKAMMISALLSGIIHGGFFLIGGIVCKAPVSVPTQVYEEVGLVDDLPPPLFIVKSKEATPREEESTLPDALVSTGLAEPPHAAVLTDALTQYTLPYASYVKRPDSVLKVSIPSGAERIGRSKAQEYVIFTIEQLDCVPRLRKGANPSYPRQLLAAHIEGIVRMLVLLDVKGRVTVRRVLDTNRVEFEQSAIEAAERFVYDPPTRNGRPVNTEFVLPIRFEIE